FGPTPTEKHGGSMDHIPPVNPSTPWRSISAAAGDGHLPRLVVSADLADPPRTRIGAQSDMVLTTRYRVPQCETTMERVSTSVRSPRTSSSKRVGTFIRRVESGHTEG
ncbi:MAG: hypothetical protein ABI035_10795, partial [Gemmatimonadaceae bacterium]